MNPTATPSPILAAAARTPDLAALRRPDLAAVPAAPAPVDAYAPQPTAPPVEVERLGTIAVDHPGFVALMPLQPGGPLGLVISSFRVFGGGAVRWVKDVGTALRSLDDVAPQVVTTDLLWPNRASALPASALPVDGLAVPSGFLVPGKGNGAVSIVAVKDGEPAHPIAITPARTGWFHHQVEWADVNGDGRLDAVTARARTPMFGSPQGALVWLEQPEDAPLANPWSEHVIAQGPDVHFQMADLDGDGQSEIIAARFFDREITVYWREQDRWMARPVDAFGSRSVDAQLGAAFDLQLTDLNGDGRLDLLATNHQGDGTGSVFGYEIPPDFKSGPWIRHTLQEGIGTRPGFQSASPGQAQAFWPDPAHPTGKPSILVAGDGAQQAWVLTPRSADKEDWGYTSTLVTDTACTVGGCAVGDVDGDGCVEVFVPAFERDEVQVFRLRSAGAPAPQPTR